MQFTINHETADKLITSFFATYRSMFPGNDFCVSAWYCGYFPGADAVHVVLIDNEDGTGDKPCTFSLVAYAMEPLEEDRTLRLFGSSAVTLKTYANFDQLIEDIDNIKAFGGLS